MKQLISALLISLALCNLAYSPAATDVATKFARCTGMATTEKSDTDELQVCVN